MDQSHLPRAKHPFRFFTHVDLMELTGLRARNLRELADILKTVPGSVIYHHTHRFLKQHQYLSPEPPNDFALWAAEAMQDPKLAERLAAVDTVNFKTLRELRAGHGVRHTFISLFCALRGSPYRCMTVKTDVGRMWKYRPISDGPYPSARHFSIASCRTRQMLRRLWRDRIRSTDTRRFRDTWATIRLIGLISLHSTPIFRARPSFLRSIPFHAPSSPYAYGFSGVTGGNSAFDDAPINSRYARIPRELSNPGAGRHRLHARSVFPI